MTAFLLLANTAESKSHSFFDALPHMAGMGVVMITLAVLWGVCAFTAKMVGIAFPEKALAKPVAATAVTSDPGVSPAIASAPAPDDSRVPSEIVAVIAAAVATVMGGQPVRIVSIKPMSTSWERAGRQSVLTSHRIR